MLKAMWRIAALGTNTPLAPRSIGQVGKPMQCHFLGRRLSRRGHASGHLGDFHFALCDFVIYIKSHLANIAQISARNSVLNSAKGISTEIPGIRRLVAGVMWWSYGRADPAMI